MSHLLPVSPRQRQVPRGLLESLGTELGFRVGGIAGRSDPGRGLVDRTRRLAGEVSELRFARPISHVYNPLEYAWALHEQYLCRFGGRRGVALLLGMNPGPWGMAQTGVPFGEVGFVRDWLGLDGRVDRPVLEHPKRPVLGLSCERSEVSGSRLWGWARDRYSDPDKFFDEFFVWNYCPLSFMIDSGANFTPDKLPKSEREPLFAMCDAALADVVKLLAPKMIVGIGKFAAKRAERALGVGAPIGSILHPSPASPIANRGWAPQAETQLAGLGLLDMSNL